MATLELNTQQLGLIARALEIVYQVDGLGFSDRDKDLSVDTQEIVEEAYHDDEISFNE